VQGHVLFARHQLISDVLEQVIGFRRDNIPQRECFVGVIIYRCWFLGTAHKEVPMRKYWAFIIILVTVGLLAGPSWAGTIKIGKHSIGQVQGDCRKAGGTFTEQGGSWGCITDCSGTTGGCSVNCTKAGCEGTCPRCAARTVSVRGRAMDRILTNSV